MNGGGGGGVVEDGEEGEGNAVKKKKDVMLSYFVWRNSFKLVRWKFLKISWKPTQLFNYLIIFNYYLIIQHF